MNNRDYRRSFHKVDACVEVNMLDIEIKGLVVEWVWDKQTREDAERTAVSDWLHEAGLKYYTIKRLYSTNRITFKLEEEERKVVVATDDEWITLDELFMLWVDFASGCGYVVDKAEAENKWFSRTEGVKLTKAIEALEGVAGLAEGHETLAPQLAKAVEILGELKQ